MAALSLAVMGFIGWASGLGFGWIYTLGTANVVRSWMSPPTLLALGTGQVGILLGLGDHTTAVLSLTRGIGVLIIMVMVGLAVAGSLPRPAAPDRWPRRRAGRHACCCSPSCSPGTCCGRSFRWPPGPPAPDSGRR